MKLIYENGVKHPKQTSKSEFASLGHEAQPILSVIRAKCIDCCCGAYSEVANCTSMKCALWPYRMGTNPFRNGRTFTEEQKAASADRMQKAREARASKKA